MLVTDGEQRSCLAVVRSLGRAGHEVVVCSAEPRPLAAASRYCRAFHAVPDPTKDPAGFEDTLRRLVDEERAEVVLPLTDVSASLVLGLRETHPDTVVPFPSRASYEEISDKKRLTEMAAAMGIPVPPQRVLADAAQAGRELRALAVEPGFPLVLKPSRSAVLDEGGVARFGVTIVASSEQLVPALDAYPASAYPILAQKLIRGPGLGAFLLVHEGRTVASFAHRRLREKPPTGGVSVYRESVPLREDIARYAEDLLSRCHWNGVAMVEFKEDSATGVPYLMEVNGRFWGSLQLAVDAGVDFPSELVRLALGGEPVPLGDYAVGVRSRWFWGDVDHLLWMLLRAPRGYRGTYPALPTRLGALARFLLPWRRRTRLEVLRAHDPLPFVRESAQWLGHLTRR